ncbi:hypothetical protein [Streptococcus salivarius]
MNTFNLFKQINEELEEKIGLNISDYFLNYDTDVEKKEILNSVEPNTIQIMSDLDSSWTADYDNLTIKQTIKIENPSYLFGPDGVTLEKNKLGIGVHVHSRTSMFQETIAMAEVCKNDIPLSFDLVYSFPKGKLRGKVHIETFFYVKELNETYPTHADLQGMRVSQKNISELILIIDGAGSMFPIGEFEEKNGPLWKLKIKNFNPTEDLFSTDNINLLLNKSHSLFKQLKERKTALSRGLMSEIVSQAMSLIIDKVIKEIEDDEIISDSADGTILSIVNYWISVFEVETSDSVRISNSLKLALEQILSEE